MPSCKYIDAQMVDWLYDELAPTEKARFDEHVQGCTECHGALESLSAVRAMLRDLPELDPPAAGAAILMHEAGKRAPARSHDEKAGALAWLMGWLQPVLAHPGLAAAASLVLVVTVAGSLYLRGESQYAKPTHTTENSAVNAMNTPAAAPGEPAATETWAGAQAGAQAADQQEQAALTRDEYRAEVVGGTLADELAQADPAEDAEADQAGQGDKAVAVEPPGRELPLKKLGRASSDPAPKKDAEWSRNDGVARGRLQARSSSQPSKPSGKSETVAADRGMNAGVIAGMNAGVDTSMDMADDDDLSSQSALEARKGASASVYPGAVEDAEYKAKKSAPRRAPAASKAGEGTATRYAAPPPPPADMPAAQAPAPESERAFRPTSATTRDTRAELAWAKSRHSSLNSAAKSKRCTDAARIAVDILERNPNYYHGNNVEGSKEMKSCLAYVAEERRVRAQRRSKAASSKAASSKAADQAAPAEQAEPAQAAPAKK